MSSAKDWFKADPIDWLEGLETLEDEAQVAVYSVVILRIYASGGPIPNNAEAIAVHARMSRTRTARTINLLLEAGKLYLVGDKLMQHRAADELAVRAELSRKRAAAGREGGTRSKPTKNLTETDQLSDHFEEKNGESGRVFGSGMAEIRHSDKAFASTRAQEERRGDKNTSPTPPSRSAAAGLDVSDDPLSAHERTEALLGIGKVVKRDTGDVDIPKLTADVMRVAKMAVPPVDLILVSSWVSCGMEPDEIVQIATRMASTSRSPIRQMRYFDAEMRRVQDAKTTAASGNIAYFERIKAKARA